MEDGGGGTSNKEDGGWGECQEKITPPYLLRDKETRRLYNYRWEICPVVYKAESIMPMSTEDGGWGRAPSIPMAP